MTRHLPPSGRGTHSNRSGRYEATSCEAFDDGWTEHDPSPPPRTTTLLTEHTRKALSYNTSPDLSFDRTLNPYRGCEHGCSYCYARPNHAYAGLSPGVDFESQIFVKTDIVETLARELGAKRYAARPIVFSGVTDAYQPAERTHELTRRCLELLVRCKHPFSIVTKSALVLRDVDLLSEAAKDNLVSVAVSVTTLDKDLARRLEPRASAPHRRLAAMSGLAEAGVPVSVMAAPMIPALNDHELEGILEAAAGAGASGAGYVLLRLPLEVKDLFREWLEEHRPDRAERVWSLIRQAQGGKDYDPAWHKRGRGHGPVAELLHQRFKAARARLRLGEPREDLRTDLFTPPPRTKKGAAGQLDLFAT
jgi:DNA repair photolyase